MICKDYKKIKKLGEGSYGKVYHAVSLDNQNHVAIKEMKNIYGNNDQGIPSTTLREISILREWNHINIVKLLEIYNDEDTDIIYIIFEYVELDLKKYLKFNEQIYDELKYIFRQIILGVDNIHANSIIHRDLKTNNILYDPKNKLIKIADFGLARIFNIPFRKYSKDVGTIYYRPPEVIMGSGFYGLGYDIWSLGVILIELFYKVPFIRGKSHADQLFKIFQVLGKPNKEIWPNVINLPDFSNNFPDFPSIGIKKYLYSINEKISKTLNEDYFDLVEKMLNLNPNLRPMCSEILNHPFLKN